jgi:hypothetical protein
MDDLFHDVKAVKAFPTDNDTELERRNACLVVKRWWIMGFGVVGIYYLFYRIWMR